MTNPPPHLIRFILPAIALLLTAGCNCPPDVSAIQRAEAAQIASIDSADSKARAALLKTKNAALGAARTEKEKADKDALDAYDTGMAQISVELGAKQITPTQAAASRKVLVQEMKDAFKINRDNYEKDIKKAEDAYDAAILLQNTNTATQKQAAVDATLAAETQLAQANCNADPTFIFYSLMQASLAKAESGYEADDASQTASTQLALTNQDAADNAAVANEEMSLDTSADNALVQEDNDADTQYQSDSYCMDYVPGCALYANLTATTTAVAAGIVATPAAPASPAPSSSSTANITDGQYNTIIDTTTNGVTPLP